MALAIHFEGLVSDGAVRNYRELAEAGQVSRARLSCAVNRHRYSTDAECIG